MPRTLLIVATCVTYLLAGCNKIAPQSPAPAPAPPMKPSRPAVGDFAEARRGFHTNLVRKGPSPQRFQATKAPPDVDQVEYTSGHLRLKAWFVRGTGQGNRVPAVLFLHGGWAFGMDVWQMAQPFRDAGFAV